MAQNQKYALNTELIETVIKEFFVKKETCCYTISRNDATGAVIKVFNIKNKNQTGTLLLYYVKGQVSHQSQGFLRAVCEDCFKYMVDTISLPDSSVKCFKLANVKEDDFDTFVECVAELDDVTITETAPNEKLYKHVGMVDKYNAQISMCMYKTGTLTIQGLLTPLFITVMNECMETLGDVEDEEFETFFEFTNAAPITLSTDISSYLDKPEVLASPIIKKLILSSVNLLNNGKDVADCGAYTFSVLKALDALISLKLTGGNPVNAFKNFSEWFRPTDDTKSEYVFCDHRHEFDANPSLKKTLEEGYTYIAKERHTSFHIDRDNIEASRLVSFNEALEIFHATMDHINKICNKW